MHRAGRMMSLIAVSVSFLAACSEYKNDHIPMSERDVMVAADGSLTQDVEQIELDRTEIRPFIHLASPFLYSLTPTGLTPDQIKKAYNLPATGGSGTIAIIIAYDAPNNEADLNTFSAYFGLPECTTANGCFEKYRKTSDCWGRRSSHTL